MLPCETHTYKPNGSTIYLATLTISRLLPGGLFRLFPSQLRSAVELHKFFENLFPGEVYTVEIALDLTELNRVDAERKAVGFQRADVCVK
jgi:hypothetical protein